MGTVPAAPRGGKAVVCRKEEDTEDDGEQEAGGAPTLRPRRP